MGKKSPSNFKLMLVFPRISVKYGVGTQTAFMLHIMGLWFVVFNATFNNILVISWRSVLLVEELPGENHRPAASH